MPVRDAPVLAEHVADLALAHADVAGRDVGVLAQVAVQLGHEGLAEAHHLAVRAALRVEVRAALAAADRHPGERVLEDLLEAEELHDREVHRGVEADAALVGAERAVEARSRKPRFTRAPGRRRPARSPGRSPGARARPAARSGRLGVLRAAGEERPEALEHLEHRLVELRLARRCGRAPRGRPAPAPGRGGPPRGGSSMAWVTASILPDASAPCPDRADRGVDGSVGTALARRVVNPLVRCGGRRPGAGSYAILEPPAGAAARRAGRRSATP